MMNIRPGVYNLLHKNTRRVRYDIIWNSSGFLTASSLTREIDNITVLYERLNCVKSESN